ncbi:hypothetical protein SUGI_0832990 [Cryptomeria japonica]|nr:hypothetical protein SUGI_0832990 [Cryptomeria japonica]
MHENKSKEMWQDSRKGQLFSASSTLNDSSRQRRMVAVQREAGGSASHHPACYLKHGKMGNARTVRSIGRCVFICTSVGRIKAKASGGNSDREMQLV